jgi:hypothetical protein
MGQDTFVNLGVSVTFPFKLENISLIKNIYNLRTFEIYISGLHSCQDEISSLEDNYIITPENFEEIINIDNNELLHDKLKKYKNINIHFLYGCCSAYARNISRRHNPSIFLDTDISIDDSIDDLTYSKKRLLEVGVLEENIKFGYNFFDSF